MCIQGWRPLLQYTFRHWAVESEYLRGGRTVFEVLFASSVSAWSSKANFVPGNNPSGSASARVAMAVRRSLHLCVSRRSWVALAGCSFARFLSNFQPLDTGQPQDSLTDFAPFCLFFSGDFLYVVMAPMRAFRLHLPPKVQIRDPGPHTIPLPGHLGGT